jgi:Fe-S cluster assembly protein SufD
MPAEIAAAHNPIDLLFREEAARVAWDRDARRAALDLAADLPMPNWRRGRGWTLEPPAIEFGAYDLAPAADVAHVDGSGAIRLRDGRLVALPTDVPSGVRVFDLALPLPDDLAAQLDRCVGAASGKFAALNRGAYTGGVAIEVTPGARPEAAIEIHHDSAGLRALAMPRILVWVRAGARARLLESVRGGSEAAGLTVSVSELILDEGAELEYVDLTGLGSQAIGVIRRQARLGPHSRVTWTSAAFGGRFLNVLWKADLMGEEAQSTATGIYVTTGQEQHALESRTEHLAPHTRAHVVFRGAVGGRGRSVFDGVLASVKTAYDTQSYLGDHILFLSSEARADAIPRLDIEGSDVNIQHGASVGRVDPEQIHYLMTRGIGPELARELLVMGYFDPTLARIPDEGLRHAWRQEILDRVRA